MTVVKKQLFSASSASLRQMVMVYIIWYHKIFVELRDNRMTFNSAIDCLTIRTFLTSCI